MTPAFGCYAVTSAKVCASKNSPRRQHRRFRSLTSFKHQCLHCLYLFNTPARITLDWSAKNGIAYRETEDACPNCGSLEFAAATEVSLL